MTRGRSSTGNLGADVTSFVGRRHETAEVKRLLSVSRLVTLTGVGGVGKTRLALRVAADLERTVQHGAWFVDLAPLDDEGLLTQTVASALGLQDRSSGWSITVIANHLRDKELLLVLDNCEHLRDGCAVLIDALLRQAPKLRVLTTSRHTLSLTSEQVFQVPALSLPDEHAGGARSMAHFEAISLFVERAKAVRPTFELTADNASAVGAICRRLDGVPLAIELAAARLSALSVHDLLQRLENRFQLLVGGSAAASPRHQALRELIRWSWDLCTEGEQVLWGRISVFPSHFDLAAAEAICAGGSLEESSIVPHLTALVDKTIVMAQENGNGRIRYRMLETLREYGCERLHEAGEEDAVRAKHRTYYRELVSSASSDLVGPRQKQWLEKLRLEHSNIRMALDASFSEEQAGVDAGLEMVSELWIFWIAAGATSEARRWLDRGLRHSSNSSSARTRALITCAYLCVMEQDVASGRQLLAEAKRGFTRNQDPAIASRLASLTALAALSEGDLVSAEPILHEILPQQLAARDHFGFVDTSFCLAAVKGLRGELDEAESICRAAIRLCDDQEESWAKSYMLWCLAFVYLERGATAEATAYAQEGLRLASALDDPWGIACCLELLAWIATANDDTMRACRLLGAAQGVWGRTGVSLFGIRDLNLKHDACVSFVRGAVGEDVMRSAADAGEAMDLSQVIGQALGVAPPVLPPTSTVGVLLPPLTKRESEVALLIAEGRTNKEIAARLVVAQRTAEAHVERVLGKLGFTSRTQVATWVVGQTGTDAT